MPDVDLERAERLAAEFWTEPGDQQAARTLLVALVARVRDLERRDAAWMVREAEWVGVMSKDVGRIRALTDAGNTLADVTYNLLSGSDRPTLDAALDAWRTLVAASSTDQPAAPRA